VLVWAVEVDTTPARPALLAALGALAGRDRVPPRVLTRVVGHLGHTTLSPVEEDMRADLVAHLARVSASG
jgi:hypothetical protein